MSKQKEMSPMEAFKWALKAWAIFVVVTFGGCVAGFKFDAPYSRDVATEVTLVQAYSTMQKCGSKNHFSCEEFKGLFRDETTKATYTRAMTGFFYYNYIDGGKKEIPGAWITLSANDRGIETPLWIKFLMSLGVVGGFVFLAGGMCFLLGSVDAEFAQEDWERKKAREERDAKHARGGW